MYMRWLLARTKEQDQPWHKLMYCGIQQNKAQALIPKGYVCELF